MQELADRLAVRELLDAYSQLVNQRDWRRVGSLFAEDGVWHVLGLPQTRLIEGREAVEQAVAAAVSKYAFLVQMNHAPLINIKDDAATALSTINEVGQRPDGSGLNLLGHYEDDIIRVGGAWKFKKRTFRAVYLAATPTPSG